VRNPIRSSPRIPGVALRLFVAAVIVASLGAAGAARADNPVLTGEVGVDDSFAITLKDPSGAPIAHVDAGTYTLVIHDHSTFHDFHLTGPGVDVTTGIEEVGDRTFTVTLTDGKYDFQCDPHFLRMRGSFGVGTFTLPPPPTKATASIGPGAAFSFKPATGLKAGKFTITVNDRTAKDGFRLAGPGLTKSTGVKFKGSTTWTVTLKAGKYTFGSALAPKQRRSVTISG
jgi:plastocyanin